MQSVKEVRQISWHDFEADAQFWPLVNEYAHESANKEMPPINPHLEMYRAMEKAGVLYTFGAFVDGQIVGFMNVLLTTIPHYSVKAATTESFFVAAGHRKSGLGLRMLRAAETLAREMGAAGIYVSSPVGERLAKVLPRAGYRHSNEVFFRGLA